MKPQRTFDPVGSAASPLLPSQKAIRGRAREIQVVPPGYGGYEIPYRAIQVVRGRRAPVATQQGHRGSFFCAAKVQWLFLNKFAAGNARGTRRAAHASMIASTGIQRAPLPDLSPLIY